jgi:hypothetical protein
MGRRRRYYSASHRLRIKQGFVAKADRARAPCVGFLFRCYSDPKISHDDAAKQFDDIQAKLKQTRDKAVQVAKDTADASASAASKTTFAGFGVLLLGLIAAAIGGSLAVQQRLLVTRHTVDGRALGI